MGNKIHIVLALGNEPMSDTFVEIEDGNGNAIDIGDRVPRGDGTCAIVLDDPRALASAQARITELEARCKPWLDAIDDHAADGVTVEQVIDKERDTIRARIAELEVKTASQQEWIDRAVASCTRRRCSQRDARIAELDTKTAELEADKARLDWLDEAWSRDVIRKSANESWRNMLDRERKDAAMKPSD